MDNAHLVVLLESDMEALSYFTHLPQPVRSRISQEPQGVGDLKALRTRAGYLMSQG